MTRTFVNIAGVVLILVGLAGFAAPTLAGTHLSVAHNIIHLVSGALALYFGTKGSLGAMRAFCFVFGIVYGVLGIVGFAAGSGMDRMLTVIPGQLELGRMDHIIHVALGIVFVALGFATRGVTVVPQHKPAGA